MRASRARNLPSGPPKYTVPSTTAGWLRTGSGDWAVGWANAHFSLSLPTVDGVIRHSAALCLLPLRSFCQVGQSPARAPSGAADVTPAPSTVITAATASRAVALRLRAMSSSPPDDGSAHRGTGA